MRRLPLAPLSALTVAVVLLTTSAALAQSAANILLVANESSADSVAIAGHYARVRSLPADQVLRLKVDATDEIDRASFNARIYTPIASWLQQHAAQDRILYIVLTKGIPLRIKGTAGRTGTVSSVDSELTLLYRRLVGQVVAVDGRVDNPYFLGAAPVDQAKPFNRDAFDIYLVTRLDAFTVTDTIGLIDRAAKPSRDGRILLDQKTV